MTFRTVRKAATALALIGGLFAATSAGSQPVPGCALQCWRDCLAQYPGMDDESIMLRDECYVLCLNGTCNIWP